MYRIALEYILGLRVRGDRLVIEPCVPRSWPGFTARIRRGAATYTIHVDNMQSEGKGIIELSLDGTQQPKGSKDISFADDGKAHEVRVILGSEPLTRSAAVFASSGGR
jgi:cyclic beta-1,2-glucan synthetase